ncbi:hypothetical protein EDD16DRAFT_1077582 [Pisolithus croceorrhizus]|nr:hypothetical protein EDD16DRAFT_1077582 [Pisolithus croceorrhizus]KAI6163198.1 hypothetical protein EDD17DRAFT_518543 [Pisolithus thermaeus]
MQRTPEPAIGSKRAHSPRPPPAKRAKAAQACLSCRKHKTRCEVLDGESGVQCHRCNVLNLTCSFEDTKCPIGTSSSRVTDIPKVDRRACVPTSSSKASEVILDGSFDPSKGFSKSWESPAPDSPSSFRDQPLDKVEVDFSDPKRLLPEQQRPWGLLKLPGGFDGTTVPMLAMQALIRSGVSGEDALKSKIQQSLFHVLGRERIQYLTEIFEERYNPWLNLQPNHHSDSPVVQLAQCCVASRHLDPPIRLIVTPQLYRLADEAIFKQVFNPLPSTDAILATHIHSLWTPVGDSASREARDGRLLATAAVSMAMNLRLSEAMAYALTLGKQKKPSEPPSSELVEALDKARLWFSLNNVETMLCHGTGRDAISDCSKLVHDAIPTTSVATVPLARDMRLMLTSRLLALTTHGLSLKLQSKNDLAILYRDMTDFLVRMDNLERLITPFTEHEVFYFSMLQFYYQTYRLMVILHAMMELKRVYENDKTEEPWFECVEHNGVKLVVSWGSQALAFAHGALTTALSRHEDELLSAAPDHFFAMITLATLYVILCKWSEGERGGEQLSGSCDLLLSRTVERLSHISCSPDHSAAKCARVIDEGFSSVRIKIANRFPRETSRTTWQQHSSAPTQGYVEENRSAAYSTISPSCGYTDGGNTATPHSAIPHDQAMNLPPPPPSFSMTDPNYFNSEIFFDNEFWALFMANLSEDSGMYIGR